MEYDECKKKGKLWFYKGLANYELGKYKESLQDFKKALNHNYYDVEKLEKIIKSNEIFESLSEKIFLLYHLKRYDDAIKTYDQNLEESCYIGPRDQEPEKYKDASFEEEEYFVALSKYELKRYKDALINFDRISRRNIVCLDAELCDPLNKSVASKAIDISKFKKELDEFEKWIAYLIINVEGDKNFLKLNKIEKKLPCKFERVFNENETVVLSSKVSKLEKSIRVFIEDFENEKNVTYMLKKIQENVADIKNEIEKGYVFLVDSKPKIKEDIRFDNERKKICFTDSILKKFLQSCEKSEMDRNTEKDSQNCLTLKECLPKFKKLIDEHKKIIANSWYYKGLILHELRNGCDAQGSLEQIFENYSENEVTHEENNELQELIDNEETKISNEYESWDNNKKKKFVNFLSKRLQTQSKAREAFQKIIDIESRRAFEEAFLKYEKCIETSRDIELYYDKALVLEELKRYKEANESLDELLENDPQHARAWYRKGKILFKLSEDEKAKDALDKSIKYFKILTEENQNNPDHWYNKGAAHSNLAEVLGKPKKQQDDEEILKKQQDVKAEYEKAIKAFDNATNLNPIYSLAWNNKGNTYLKLKKYSRAIEAFKKAVEINPNYDLARNNQGNALSLTGEYEEAIKIYSKVVDKNHNPSFYKSWNNKGLALSKLERYDEAINAFDKAIEVNPTFADAWSNKGLVLYKLDIKSEAKKSFEKAFEIEPENASASNNLGVIFSWYGELDRAKKLFEHTIQEDSDNVLGHAYLAELFLSGGSVEKASKEVKEALDLLKGNTNDDISSAYVYCLDGRVKIEGQSKDENGKYGEAVESFEKATSYDIEDPTLILWSVYGKYLCQKFGTNEEDKTGDESNKDQSDEKEESSEESKANSGNTSSESGEKNPNEHFLSIISDLERVLHFCNRPAIKRNSVSESVKQNLLMQFSLFACSISIILLTIFLISEVGLFDLINEFLEWIWDLIQNLMSTKILFLLILLLILFLLISVCLLVGLVIKDFEIADLKILKKEIPLLYSPAMKIFQFESIFERIRSALKSMVSNTIDIGPESSYQKISATYTDSELNSAIKINTQLAKLDCHKDIKAYALYLLGYFYYKLQDCNTAKEKLQECIRLKSGTKTDKAAKNLLANIWKHEIKPPFWTYWFNSPVKTWRRRSFGFLTLIGILLLLFVHPENSAPATLEEYPWNITDGEQNADGIKYIIIPTNNSTLNITGPVQMKIYSSNISNDSNINKSSNNLSSIEMDIHSSKIFYDPNIKTLSNKSFLTNNSTSNIFVHIRMDIHSSTVNTSSTATNLSTNNTILYFNTSSNTATLSTNNTTLYVNTPSNARTFPINNTTLNISDYTRMSINSSKIFYSSDDTSTPTNNTTLNVLVPTKVNIYPQIPDNAFAGILLFILILILISPSIRIKDALTVTFNREVAGSTLNLTTEIEAPPEFNFELSPSLMQDVIKKLDENL